MATATEPEAVDSALTPWSPQLLALTIGCVSTNTANAFSVFAVSTTLPRTVSDLGGLNYYGWAFSAYMLASLVGLTVAGAEADRRGPGRTYLAGMVCFCAGLLIAGLAPSMPVLILGRAIQGFGGGLVGSAVWVVVGRSYPESAQPRMLALLSSSGIIPALVGPAVSGLIADYVSWRAAFFAVLPFAIIAIPLTYPRIRAIGSSPPEAAPNWRRIVDAFALAGSTALLISGLSSSKIPLATAMVTVGGAVACWMLARLTPAGTLRLAAGLPAAIGLMMIVSMGYFGVNSYVPLVLMDIRHQSASFAGLALTTAALAWSGGAWIQAHYSDKRNRRQIVRTGLVFVVVAIVGMAAILFDAVPVIVAPLAWTLGGLGMGFVYPSLSLTVLQSAEPGKEGIATSGMQIGFVLGTALGAGVGGVLLAALSDGTTVNRSALMAQYLLMIGVLVVAFAAVQRLPEWPGERARSERT